MIHRSFSAAHKEDKAVNVCDDQESCETVRCDPFRCSKTVVAAIIEFTVDWTKPPIYDEYPEEDFVSVESKEFTTCSAPQLLPSSTTLVSKRPRFDDWDWIEELIIEQRTKLFETYGSIRGFEGHFIMDSGSQGNLVSQYLVSRLNLPIEDIPSPYYVQWLNQGSMKLVTKRCLVEFSFGNEYEDKIWCDVMPMDACHVLLGRPWQWDRNVVY